MPKNAVVLFLDATILRLFPPLRFAWAFRGEQAEVRISGRNAKRVLVGVINPGTSHRLVLRRFGMRQEDFQAMLRQMRRRYPGRPIWLLLDRAPCHEALKSQQLAARLGIVFLWLPKQCSELTAMDQLWKELKRLIAANRQFRTVDEGADYAEQWLLGLSPRQALRKASVLSDDFWLKDFLEHFWLPTYVLSPTASGAVTATGNATVQLPGGLSVSSNAAAAVTVSGNATATLQPGVYSSITVSGNAAVTLAPGRYVIRGGGLTVSGNASLSGTGVFVFNAGSAYDGTTDGGTYGAITFGGNGTLSLSPCATAGDP